MGKEIMIYEIFEKIVNDKEKTDKFLEIETMDEIYDYFLKQIPDLSKTEFDNFITEMLEKSELLQNFSENTKIDDNTLKTVSGGFNLGTKITASMLAFMSFLPSAGATQSTKNSYGNMGKISQSITQNLKSAKNVLVNKISNAYTKTKDWIIKHPKLSAGIGLAALVLSSFVTYKLVKKHSEKKQKKIEIQNTYNTFRSLYLKNNLGNFEPENFKTSDLSNLEDTINSQFNNLPNDIKNKLEKEKNYISLVCNIQKATKKLDNMSGEELIGSMGVIAQNAANFDQKFKISNFKNYDQTLQKYAKDQLIDYSEILGNKTKNALSKAVDPKTKIETCKNLLKILDEYFTNSFDGILNLENPSTYNKLRQMYEKELSKAEYQKEIQKTVEQKNTDSKSISELRCLYLNNPNGKFEPDNIKDIDKLKNNFASIEDKYKRMIPRLQQALRQEYNTICLTSEIVFHYDDIRKINYESTPKSIENQINKALDDIDKQKNLPIISDFEPYISDLFKNFMKSAENRIKDYSSGDISKEDKMYCLLILGKCYSKYEPLCKKMGYINPYQKYIEVLGHNPSTKPINLTAKTAYQLLQKDLKKTEREQIRKQKEKSSDDFEIASLLGTEAEKKAEEESRKAIVTLRNLYLNNADGKFEPSNLKDPNKLDFKNIDDNYKKLSPILQYKLKNELGIINLISIITSCMQEINKTGIGNSPETIEQHVNITLDNISKGANIDSNNFSYLISDLFKTCMNSIEEKVTAYSEQNRSQIVEISRIIANCNAKYKNLYEEMNYPGLKIKTIEKIYFDQSGKTQFNKTALMHAIENADKDIVDLLLNQSINVNEKDTMGRTPLMYAAVRNYCVEILKLLLDKGKNIDINATDSEGNNALIYAVDRGNIDAVKLLLQKKELDINKKNNKNETALTFAIRRNNLELVKLLLEKGADVNNANKLGITILMEATKCKPEIIKLLLDERNNIDINMVDPQGNTALMYAASGGYKNALELLLKEEKIAINQKNNSGMTALTYAIEKNSKDMVEALINKGINVNITDSEGRTALIRAAAKENMYIVDLLLKKGVDVAHKDVTGKTAIFYAIKTGNYPILKLLLDNGKNIDINTTDTGGYTALMHAAKCGNKKIVEILLQKGANPTIKSSDGKTALEILILSDNYNPETEALLKRYMPADQTTVVSAELVEKYSRKLIDASISCDIEEVKRLLEKGANVNKLEKDTNRTALIIAVDHNRNDIVKLLLQKNADVNHKDVTGRTALMYAIENNNTEIVKLLLNSGADVNQTNKAGQTALIIAVNHNRNDIVKLLLQKNADVNHKDATGKTALNYAVIYRNEEIIKLLTNSRIESQKDEEKTTLMGANKPEDTKTEPKKDRGKTTLMHTVKPEDTKTEPKKDRDKTTLMHTVKPEDIETKPKSKDSVTPTAPRHTSKVTNIKELINAIWNGDNKKVQSLIKQNIDVDQEDKNKETALMHAACLGETDIIKLLLDVGADVDKTNTEGQTALMMAAARGYTKIIELLLAKKANVKIADRFGATALMMAAMSGHTKIVELLLNSGADANQKDKAGKTALNYSIKNHQEETTKLLKNAQTKS